MEPAEKKRQKEESTRRFDPRAPGTLVHKEGLNNMRTNEADREVNGFRCKLTTCKCQELHGPRRQHGHRIHGRNGLDREQEHCTGKPFEHHTS